MCNRCLKKYKKYKKDLHLVNHFNIQWIADKKWERDWSRMKYKHKIIQIIEIVQEYKIIQAWVKAYSLN